MDEELRIAWRYKDYVDEQIAQKQRRMQQAHYASTSLAGDEGRPAPRKPAASATGTVLCHEYDLSKAIQQELWAQDRVQSLLHVVDEADALLLDGDGEAHHPSYEYLLRRIAHAITESQNSENEANRSGGKIVRISIESLGSGLLANARCGSQSSERGLLQFLLALKALLRQTLSVCLITIPTVALKPQVINRVLHVCDVVFEMRSFVGSRIDVSDYEFKEYSGLFELKKLPRMNSLVLNYSPDSLQFAFKLKKRKMYIEKLHMPPEETRQASDPNRIKFKLQPSATAGGGTLQDQERADRSQLVRDPLNQRLATGSSCGAALGVSKNDLDF
jgi:elongator complex protein 4